MFDGNIVSYCLRKGVLLLIVVVVVVVVVVVDYAGHIQINIFATPLPPAGSMTGSITVDHNTANAATEISDCLKNSYEYSLSISFLKEFLHLSLSLYCFVSIIFEFIFKVPNILCLCQIKFATRQSCDDIPIMCLVMFSIVAGRIWYYSKLWWAVVGFQRGNYEGIPRGWPSRANPSLACACMAMKYQPQTQAFRSGFVSQLWSIDNTVLYYLCLEKSDKSCETKSGTEKRCETKSGTESLGSKRRVWIF